MSRKIIFYFFTWLSSGELVNGILSLRRLKIHPIYELNFLNPYSISSHTKLKSNEAA